MLYRAPQDGATGGPRGRPIRGVPPATRSWQSGVYVFTVRDTAGAVRSFAIDLEIITLHGPAAAPTPTPAP
jgi:hypothetical protein